ncbi:unnamed protein product [Bursaphelenchus xylophilus]|uniref:(pine wood nematode) hypothetical protein n=1 Tax=Bursaphelenchus xylophilus TaxID=6326 RepID=A0A1I7SA75_BURXY|nr:unnamed protein product [Bursaphelenchus xylophilus]CAG9084213.1 unnamed protein product [Bursaphelenchus xylophilus]
MSRRVLVLSNLWSVRYQSSGRIDRQFLSDIVKKHNDAGSRFFLPLADEFATNKILEPLKALNLEGVKVEFLRDALVSDPEIFKKIAANGGEVVQILNILVGYCSFTFESALRFYSQNIEYLSNVVPSEMSCRLAVFTNFGILAGPQLGRIVRKAPSVLVSSQPEQMSRLIENISNFFSRKQVTKMLIQSPEIVLQSFEELELKYEYIFFHMKIESDSLSDSLNWMNLALDDIMDRHEFLAKTGKYVTPDTKRPQFEKDNPPSYRIFDSDDVNFAVQVGGVTPEEWNAFKCIKTIQRSLDEKENPFERIKPSVWKAYERRHKDTHVNNSVIA